MKDNEMLNLYKPIARYIAEICGPSCEVVLHDISDPDHSIIFIENNYHSGREVGNSLTGFAREMIKNECYKTEPFICNYDGSSKGKHYLSSTFFIKNGNRLIGLLCINRDMTVSNELMKAVESLQTQYLLVSSKKIFMKIWNSRRIR